MNKTTRVLALVMAFVLVLALAACGAKQAPAAEAPAAEAPVAEAPAAEEPAAEAPADEPDKSDWVKLNLTYATFLAADAPGQDGITLLQKKCDEYMGEGYITIETFANGSLLGVGAIYDGVADQVADLGIVLTSTKTGSLPVTMVADIAGFYYASTQAGSNALRDYLNEFQPEEHKDVIVLFPISTTPQALCTTKPIESLDDLQGLQIRATSSAADAMKAIGAVPVSMDLGEVYEALRNGLVDGCVSTPGAFANSKFQEVAPYCTVIPFIGSTSLVVMNRSVYESMPESQRTVFDRCVDETFKEFYSTYIEDFSNDPNTQMYLNDIKSIKFLDGDELAKFAEAVKDLPAAYAETLKEQGFDGDKMIARFGELLEGYNAQYPPVPDNYYKWMK